MNMFLHKNNLRKGLDGKPVVDPEGKKAFEESLPDFAKPEFENKEKSLAAAIVIRQNLLRQVSGLLQDARALIDTMDRFADDHEMLSILCDRIEKLYKNFRFTMDSLEEARAEEDRLRADLGEDLTSA